MGWSLFLLFVCIVLIALVRALPKILDDHRERQMKEALERKKATDLLLEAHKILRMAGRRKDVIAKLDAAIEGLGLKPLDVASLITSARTSDHDAVSPEVAAKLLALAHPLGEEP